MFYVLKNSISMHWPSYILRLLEITTFVKRWNCKPAKQTHVALFYSTSPIVYPAQVGKTFTCFCDAFVLGKELLSFFCKFDVKNLFYCAVYNGHNPNSYSPSDSKKRRQSQSMAPRGLKLPNNRCTIFDPRVYVDHLLRSDLSLITVPLLVRIYCDKYDDMIVIAWYQGVRWMCLLYSFPGTSANEKAPPTRLAPSSHILTQYTCMPCKASTATRGCRTELSSERAPQMKYRIGTGGPFAPTHLRSVVKPLAVSSHCRISSSLLGERNNPQDIPFVSFAKHRG